MSMFAATSLSCRCHRESTLVFGDAPCSHACQTAKKHITLRNKHVSLRPPAFTSTGWKLLNWVLQRELPSCHLHFKNASCLCLRRVRNATSVRETWQKCKDSKQSLLECDEFRKRFDWQPLYSDWERCKEHQTLNACQTCRNSFVILPFLHTFAIRAAGKQPERARLSMTCL